MWSRPLQIFLATASLLVFLSGGRSLPQQPEMRHTFGLSLNTGMNNQIFTLFILKMHGLSMVGAEPITREQFVLQVQGAVPSKANPEQENLFRKYKVEGCLHPDSTKYYLDCPLLDDLWKLRFGEYPFHPMNSGHPDKGWAAKRSSPSPGQMVKLADYGIMRLSDVVIGENVFRLLRDIGDSTWVAQYQGGS